MRPGCVHRARDRRRVGAEARPVRAGLAHRVAPGCDQDRAGPAVARGGLHHREADEEVEAAGVLDGLSTFFTVIFGLRMFLKTQSSRSPEVTVACKLLPLLDGPGLPFRVQEIVEMPGAGRLRALRRRTGRSPCTSRCARARC